MEKEDIWKQKWNMEEEKKEKIWKEHMTMEQEKKVQKWKEDMKLEEEKKEYKSKEHMQMEEEMKAEKSLEMGEKSLNIFRSQDQIGQSVQKSAPIPAKQIVTTDGDPSSKQAGVCTDICVFISLTVTLF